MGIAISLSKPLNCMSQVKRPLRRKNKHAHWNNSFRVSTSGMPGRWQMQTYIQVVYEASFQDTQMKIVICFSIFMSLISLITNPSVAFRWWHLLDEQLSISLVRTRNKDKNKWMKSSSLLTCIRKKMVTFKFEQREIGHQINYEMEKWKSFLLLLFN